MSLIEVQNLSRSFGPTQALQGLSFSVEQGEIFGLLGPDGSGKTTCLRILAGLVAPGAGRVTVLNKDIGQEPDAVKQDIGYMAQPAGLYDDLTVRENISFYADLYHVPPRTYAERLKRLLEFSGLAPFNDRYFRNLSGGMKQKAGLMCALIHTPKILFLDEPTNGVDPVSRRDFWKILYELKREQVTIVVASTYLDEVDRCHRVALFDRGRVRLVMEPLAMRTLMTGTLFKLTCSNRRQALKLLRTLPQVQNPSVFGAGIHFTLADPSGSNDIHASLTAAGLTEVQIEETPPGLEDVYLALMEETGFKGPRGQGSKGEE